MGAAAWPRHRAGIARKNRKRAPDRARFAISGAPPAGTRGMARFGMAAVRSQPARQVLPAHRGGKTPALPREFELGKAGADDCARDASGRGGVTCVGRFAAAVGKMILTKRFRLTSPSMSHGESKPAKRPKPRRARRDGNSAAKPW